MYHDYNGNEIEDLEMDNMRRDAREEQHQMEITIWPCHTCDNLKVANAQGIPANCSWCLNYVCTEHGGVDAYGNIFCHKCAKDLNTVLMNDDEYERQMQQSLRRCVEGGLPLTSELSIEPLSKEEAENLANYFESVNLSVKKIMEGPAFPINDEYCWVHDDRDGQDMGGWTCQHVECKSAE